MVSFITCLIFFNLATCSKSFEDITFLEKRRCNKRMWAARSCKMEVVDIFQSSLHNSQSNTQPLFFPLSWRTMLHIYWKMLKFSVKYGKLLTTTEQYWQILKTWTTVSPSPTSNPSFSPQFLSWWRTLLHFGTEKDFAWVKVYTDLTTHDKLNATCNMAWQLSYVTFYGP